jgi:predicted RNase H-like HicB family nuclease
MTNTYNIIIEKDKDGWYIGEVLELPGCYSQAKSMDELFLRTKEAIKCHLLESKIKIPISNFVGIQQLKV